MIKKTLILIAALFVIFIISASAYLFFLDRVKEKNFTQLLGKNIQICGEKYNSNSEKYLAVKEWLNVNKRGWHNYYISTPQTGIRITSNEEFSLVVGDDWVIASDANGTYSVNAKTDLIKTECK